MGMNTLPSAIRSFRACRIRMQKPARHHQDSVRRGVRRSQLHSASAEAAKAPYPLAPSSFPNCDRCAGSQFGDTGALPFLEVLFLSNINRKATQRSGRLSERKRKGADMKFSALAGNGMQRVSSDAAAVLFFLKKRKKRMGAQKEIGRAMPAPTPINDRAVQNRRIGPMSTRKGQAASVTLLRREQLRSASAPTFAAAGTGK